MARRPPRLVYMPVDILILIVRRLDFHSLINFVRAHSWFYQLVNLDFRSLCINNAVPRWSGERWVDAFFNAPSRNLANAVIQCPGSDLVLQVKRRSHPPYCAFLWHLDQARSPPTIRLEARPDAVIVDGAFTGDGRRLVIVSELKGTWIHSYDLATCTQICQQHFDVRHDLRHCGGGVNLVFPNREIYNYRSGEIVQIPESVDILDVYYSEIKYLPAMDTVYSYANDANEAVLIATMDGKFALYDFALNTWRIIELAPTVDGTELPSWKPRGPSFYVYGFDVQANLAVVLVLITNRLVVLDTAKVTFTLLPVRRKELWGQEMFLCVNDRLKAFVLPYRNKNLVKLMKLKPDGTILRKYIPFDPPTRGTVRTEVTPKKLFNNRRVHNFIDADMTRVFIADRLMNEMAAIPVARISQQARHKDIDDSLIGCTLQTPMKIHHPGV